MFGSIGGPELILIFVVALLIFGPRKLPELGKTIGRGLAEFKRAANDLRSTLDTEVAQIDKASKIEPAKPGASGESAPAPGPAGAGGTRDETR